MRIRNLAAKKAALAAIKNLRSVSYGDTVEFFSEGKWSEVEPRVKRALAQGYAVHYDSGYSEFYEDILEYDPSKQGSAAYTWSKDGRVQYRRYLCTKTDDNVITRRYLGTVYKQF